MSICQYNYIVNSRFRYPKQGEAPDHSADPSPASSARLEETRPAPSAPLLVTAGLVDLSTSGALSNSTARPQRPGKLGDALQRWISRALFQLAQIDALTARPRNRVSPARCLWQVCSSPEVGLPLPTRAVASGSPVNRNGTLNVLARPGAIANFSRAINELDYASALPA